MQTIKKLDEGDGIYYDDLGIAVSLEGIDGPMLDEILDSLTDQYCKTPMGITAENLAEKYDLTREACEKYSVDSHLKTSRATEAGSLKDEIISYELKRGELSFDEHVRADINIEGMQKLRTSFKKDGTVTPATASGIVDGAATLIVADEVFVKEHNLEPLAEISNYHVIGVDPTIMGIGPVDAIRALVKKEQIELGNVDLIEINEAFAAQALACQKELEIPDNKLNIWGGAIAIGHPLAATGVRVSLTLARQMKSLDKKSGIASACIGGGQGYAVYFKGC